MFLRPKTSFSCILLYLRTHNLQNSSLFKVLEVVLVVQEVFLVVLEVVLVALDGV